MLRKIIILFLLTLSIQTKLLADQNSLYPNITILNYEKINNLTEQAQPITTTASSENNTNTPNEISDIDIDITTPLLFSETETTTIYDQPNPAAKKIGYIEHPAEIQVIKIKNSFVKIKVSSDKAGWILLRDIETTDFSKKYNDKLLKAYVISSTSKPKLPPIQNIITPPQVSTENVTTSNQLPTANETVRTKNQEVSL